MFAESFFDGIKFSSLLIEEISIEPRVSSSNEPKELLNYLKISSFL